MEKLKYRLTFALMVGSSIKQEGEAVAVLEERTLSLTTGDGVVLSVTYFEILGIAEEDYSVTLHLVSGERLRLSQLGYEYENFLSNLFRNRNELLLRYMLMHEELVASGIEAEYSYTDGEEDTRRGRCEVRVYESGLVVLPDKTEPIRIPLSYLSGHVFEEYRHTVTTENSQRLILGMMGEKTDFFGRSLSKAISDADARTHRILIEQAPRVEQQKIRGAVTLMRDGRAASKQEIMAISPELYGGIEEKIRKSGLWEGYRFLLDKNGRGEIWVGIKRGLMGDRTGEYLWYMVPIYSVDPESPGNALVVESSSDGETSRATYLFSILDREEYRKSMSVEILRGEVERFVAVANRCMIEVNFRREPIYLPDDRLKEPENEIYLYAANRLNPLKLLRRHYLGRVPHVSQAQWRRGVEELLKSNVQSIDNDERWKKYSG